MDLESHSAKQFLSKLLRRGALKRRGDRMARNFMYMYERILKEQNAMDRGFGKLNINGRQTALSGINDRTGTAEKCIGKNT